MDEIELEKQLDNFDKNIRIESLKLIRKKVDNNEIKIKPNSGFVNLHAHSFFSYNAYGYSPSHIAWLAFKNGLEAIGIIDFDVLDGMEEILEAGKILGLRTSAGLETRVFIKEYEDKIINSPQEPGVFYFVGMGFYKNPRFGSYEYNTLNKLRNIAKNRNLSIVNKINEYIPEISIDYEKDVLILTPSGNATERHIIVSIDRKIRELLKNDTDKLVLFWAEKLKLDKNKILTVINSSAELQELLRLKLMKYGTIGYIAPQKGSFPELEEVINMVKNTDALPTSTWLDGTNDGEKNIKKLLTLLVQKGVVLLNIIPDRNWNIKDTKEKEVKVRNLNEVIKVARELNLPIIAGTEMNKYGQKFVDEFNVPELYPYLNDFRNGAFFVYGHTQMGLLFNKGYYSDWSLKYLDKDLVRKNKFYIEVGKSIVPGKDYSQIKELFQNNISPDEILKILEMSKN